MYLTNDATFVAPARLRALATDAATSPFAVGTVSPNAGSNPWQDTQLTGSAMRPETPSAHHNSIASTDALTNASAATAVDGATRGTSALVAKQAAPPRGRPR